MREVHLEYEDYTLENGLRVVLHREPSTPVVCINITYHVGSKDETEGKSGFAHLFEHLMFGGSANVPRGMYDQYCERAGGYNNAYTTEDKTAYYIMLPAHRLALGLWLESDRLRSLVLTAEAVEVQRQVVMEEKRQRIDNQPYGSVEEKIASLAFAGTPYGHTVIGSMEDIRAATLEDVLAFHETYYSPSNAVLSIAGDIELDEAKKLVEGYFAGIPAGKPQARPPRSPVLSNAGLREVVKDNVPLPGVFMVFPTCAETEDDFVSIDMISDVLSSGESSRLNIRLVRELQLASSVSVHVDGREYPGLTLVVAFANPGVSAGDLEEELLREIGRLTEEGIAEEELQKTRNAVETQFEKHVQRVQNRADRFAHFATIWNDPAVINTLLGTYLARDIDDLSAAARRYFAGGPALTLHYLPRENEA